MAKQGDYDGGIRELESALQAAPESTELKQLLADLQKREEGRLARVRQEQSSVARKVFDSVMAEDQDAGLFEMHQITTTKPVTEAGPAIMKALQKAQPPFVFSEAKPSEPDTFVLEAKQEWTGGYRRCVIVGGQTWPNEAQILFKVLEYTSGQGVTTLGGLVRIKSDLIFTPVHPSRVDRITDALRAQVRDGVGIVTRRLQQAVQ